jgi:hypothetical protein
MLLHTYSPSILSCIIILGILFMPSCQTKVHDSDKEETTFVIPASFRDTTIGIYVKTEDDDMFLNRDYFAVMSDAERAALGFVVMRVGNNCDWADVDEEGANGITYYDSGISVDLTKQAPSTNQTLRCEILSALGLGLQCSNKHLGYLRRWFSEDEKALNFLTQENCPKIPFTATNQTVFKHIQMTTKGDQIVIEAEITSYHFSMGVSYDWTRTAVFSLDKKGLKLVSYEDSEYLNNELSFH